MSKQILIGFLLCCLMASTFGAEDKVEKEVEPKNKEQLDTASSFYGGGYGYAPYGYAYNNYYPKYGYGYSYGYPSYGYSYQNVYYGYPKYYGAYYPYYSYGGVYG